MNLIVSKKNAGLALALVLLAASPVQATPTSTQRNGAIVAAGAAALLINSVVASYKNGTSLPAEFKRSIATFKAKIAQSLSRSKESTRSVATLSAADKYSAGIVAVTAAALVGLMLNDRRNQPTLLNRASDPADPLASQPIGENGDQLILNELLTAGRSIKIKLMPQAQAFLAAAQKEQILRLLLPKAPLVQELPAQRQNAAAAAQAVPMPEALESDAVLDESAKEVATPKKPSARRLKVVEEPEDFKDATRGVTCVAISSELAAELAAKLLEISAVALPVQSNLVEAFSRAEAVEVLSPASVTQPAIKGLQRAPVSPTVVSSSLEKPEQSSGSCSPVRSSDSASQKLTEDSASEKLTDQYLEDGVLRSGSHRKRATGGSPLKKKMEPQPSGLQRELNEGIRFSPSKIRPATHYKKR